MTRALLRRATLYWLGLFVLAFANGAFREFAIKRVIAEPWAHHLSAVTAILIFTAYTKLIWRRLNVATLREALWLGLYWFALTFLTETLLLNRLLSKMSWEQILETYNVWHGETWIFVLLWIAAMPIVIHKHMITKAK